MTILIIDGWAYRTRNDGMMESAPVSLEVFKRGVPTDKEGEPIIALEHNAFVSGVIVADWQIRQPAELGLTGGEYSTIHGMVKRIADLFPEGRTALPTSEGPRRTAANPEGI